MIPEIRTAFDLFLGYLLLDALIANTDRHHENWAIIERVIEENKISLTLAPTYDHASSLGCHITDNQRKERLTTRDKQRDVAAFCKRTRSAIYALETDTKPMSPVSVFEQGSGYSPTAGIYWLNKLDAISVNTIEELFKGVPPDRISVEATQFAISLLTINRMQLLDLREESA